MIKGLDVLKAENENHWITDVEENGFGILWLRLENESEFEVSVNPDGDLEITNFVNLFFFIKFVEDKNLGAARHDEKREKRK